MPKEDLHNLHTIYEKLVEFFGYQRWWPTFSKNKKEKFIEICVGAILTQNTAWKQVETAIKKLREKNLLNQEKLEKVSFSELSSLIKNTGFYKEKARKIKAFINFLKKNPYEKLKRLKLEEARKKLLSVYGIGNETADAILLYALDKPSFVIDNYTKRVFSRLLGIDFKSYEEWKDFFESNVKKDTFIYKEFHALIDELAKNYCKKKPICKGCPLNDLCKKNFK